MKLFGTDGVRGRANRGNMTPEKVLKLGIAIASVIAKPFGRNMVLIGKDTRLSGYLIESALTSGICSMGMNVTLVGPIPTPGIAFLTRTLRLDAGIAISASHNPFEDNGIKIFSAEGFKIPDDLEEKIEEHVFDENFPAKRPAGERIGKAVRLDDATGRYIEYVKSTIPKGMNLEGLKVVVDSANGAAYKVTPRLLTELGADVVSIHDRPDGKNINSECGSLHLDQLSRTVLNIGAHLGIAHDGDADRALFVDEKGNAVDGDLVLGLCAREMKNSGHLRGGSVVGTVMSNYGLERYLAGLGIGFVRTQVGDRHVVDEMLRRGCNLGGEQSGHIVFFDHNTTGDGPITALQVLSVLRKSNCCISELTADIALFPQVLINVPVGEKKNFRKIPGIAQALESAEKTLGKRGRILVRPSGTEQKIRVMTECEDPETARKTAEDVAGAIENVLGAGPKP